MCGRLRVGKRIFTSGVVRSSHAGTARYSFTVTDFHRLPFAGLPAHLSTASGAEVQADLEERSSFIAGGPWLVPM
jgi:hypothetical protein